MTGAQIEELIYDWLKREYPEGPTWFDERLGNMTLPPLEARMLYAFNVIEYNISNGGWSQFLWNCFDQWRPLLETAQAGYELIGADEQAQALSKLRALCEQDEQECLASLQREDGSMDTFADFTRRSYVSQENEWEQLFWGDIYDKRLAWLNANEHRIRAMVGRIDA
jgi:Domain of unknown function (DUF4375)